MGSKKKNIRNREMKSSERKAKRNKLVTISVVAVVVIAVSIALGLSAAGGSPKATFTSQPGDPTSTLASAAQQPSGLIKAKWIEPRVDGDIVSIPLAVVKDNWNIHFELNTPSGNENFMAYVVDGETYVRANVCPPCRSIGFSLNKDTLVCDTCRTTFKAKTGEGISGACVDFPKAAVPYEISDSNIVMTGNDLVTAYQNTNVAGLP